MARHINYFDRPGHYLRATLLFERPFWRDVLPGWDLSLELRHAQNIARDHVLASDPKGDRAESFYKIDSLLMFVSRKF